MKKIYLTFDIETIVSGISYNKNYLAGVYLGAMFIANELKKRDLKATFFISLSSKQININQNDYLNTLQWLMQSLKSYDNIKIAPHIHAYNLPISFECNRDQFNKYSHEQQVEMLIYAKNFFNQQGYEVDSFRPGGFSNNESYYSSLHKAGYKYSSILEKNKNANINMLTGEIFQNTPYAACDGLLEYPVTSVKTHSIKNKIELLNLSPDFFTLDSVKKYLNELNYININFHSFSIYLNRLIRENHINQLHENVKFLLFENLLNKLLQFTSMQTLNTKTPISENFIRWLDFIETNKYDTYFIGE